MYNGFMKLLAKNRRATFDYAIQDKLMAGLVLSGAEVKSAKLGNVSLKGSFVVVRDGEAWLTNAHFTPYNQAGNRSGLDPVRPRKLLLHRRELDSILSAKQHGISAVPLAMFADRGFVKMEIGLGKGKKRYDKRETLKRRSQELEAKRSVKERK